MNLETTDETCEDHVSHRSSIVNPQASEPVVTLTVDETVKAHANLYVEDL